MQGTVIERRADAFKGTVGIAPKKVVLKRRRSRDYLVDLVALSYLAAGIAVGAVLFG